MLGPINILPSQEAFVKFATSVLSTYADRCYILSTILFRDQSKGADFLHKFQINSPLAKKSQKVTSFISNIGGYKIDQELCGKQIHLLTEFLHYGEMPRNSIFVWEIQKFNLFKQYFHF